MKIRKENIFWVIVLCLVTAFLVAASYYEASRYVGDTALYAQITRNIAYGGRAESNIYANTQDFIDRGIAGMSIEDRLKSEAAFTPPEEQTRNILSFHACYILYLIAPFCYFMSAFSCVTFIQALALAFSLYFIVLLMREKKVPVALTLLTCLFLTSHPGWSMPAVYGAFYPERIFMGTGMYLVWSLEKEKFSRVHFVAATLLCCLVGERGALYAGMFILAHMVFFWKQKCENRMMKLITGVCALLYTLIEMKYVLSNIYYSNLGGKLNILNYLASEANREKVILFFLINAVLFLTIAVFEWRMYLIALASTIPNLLYDLGGAEKLGWTLHYHVFYFVFAMWAVAKGVTSFYHLLNNHIKKKNRISSLICAVLVVFIGLILTISPYDTKISFHPSNASKEVVYNGIKSIYLSYFQGVGELRKKYNEFVSENVNKGEVVSTIEAGMPALTEQNVYVFPMGIDTADAVLLGYVPEENGYYYYGAPSYYGTTEERDYFNRQIMERMQKFGYNVDEPALFPSYGIAILRRQE